MPPAQTTTRPVHAAALRRVRQRLARGDAAPWLHAEVARRMAERLSVIRLQPRALLDWGSQAGGGVEALRAAYPRAQLRLVQPDAPPAPVRGPRWSPRQWFVPTSERVAPEDLAPGSAELLWANMVLHWGDDPQALLQRWHALLAVDGFVMFSTLGPGTLKGLSALYVQRGWPPPFAPFVDMHDLGDMLVHAGFADPVMDQELLTLTWADAQSLLGELRTLGANADPQRFAGLRTPRWRARLVEALQTLAGADGRLRLQFEIVYGHAFRVAVKPRVAAETTVALDEMRAMVRAGRRGGGEA